LNRGAAPFFSIIIPVYNGVPFLAKALQSVLDQSFGDWEAIIIDDQSTDGTPQLVREIIERNPAAGIEFARMPFKQGVSPGRVRNFGIRKAKGAWVSFLDHDDQWLPTRLEKHFREISADPGLSLVHSDELLFNGDDQPLNGGKGRVESRPLLNPAELSGHCFPALFRGNPIGMSCTSVKRSVLDSVGVFDESILSEDYDLWLRIAAGHRFRFIPEPLSRYRLHEGNISKKRAIMLEGEARVIAKICESHPQKVAELGAGAREDRLYFLYRLLAASYAEAGKTSAARKILAKALREKPLSLGAWAGLLSPRAFAAEARVDPH
jgi:glycosyltransferase involved in cell wall biosynthesis